MNEFNDWLVEEEYVTDISNVEYELSAAEVYVLYQKWTDETGGTNSGLF